MAASNIKFTRFYGTKADWQERIDSNIWGNSIVFGQIKDTEKNRWEYKIYAGRVVIDSSTIDYIYDISDIGSQNKVHIDVSTCDPSVYYEGLSPMRGDYYIKEEIITEKPGAEPRRTAYIFDSSLNDGAGDWVALDGNVDATNVYFRDGVKRTAGIGRLLPVLDGSIEGKNKNLKELLEYYLWANPCDISFYNDDNSLLYHTTTMQGEIPEYVGPTPTKTSTDQSTFQFNGWNPEIGPIESDTSYIATYTSTLRSYNIIWQNWNNTKLQEKSINYGEFPEYTGQTPTKPADQQYSYIFNNWSPEPSEVVCTSTYTATYDQTLRKYTIAWKNGDGNVIETDYNVSYGETPVYNGSIPTKTSTAQFNYVFDETWTPEIGIVTGDKTYTANFTSILRTYTVDWICDGSLLERDENVSYGTKTPYNGPRPERQETDISIYTFTGWSPNASVSAIGGDTSCIAQFSVATKQYTITWKQDNGTVIDTTYVAYGKTPTHSNPSKPQTNTSTYTFTGWDPNITSVTSDQTYTATYQENIRYYGITWRNDNGDVLEQDQATYNSIPSYDGATPTKSATAQYTYVFNGWSPTPVSVVENVIYTAQYIGNLNRYTITWKDDDGTILDTSVLTYGSMPAHADPVKPSDGHYTYTFNGWTPSIGSVTGNQTYTATYTASPITESYKIYTNGTEAHINDPESEVIWWYGDEEGYYVSGPANIEISPINQGSGVGIGFGNINKQINVEDGEGPAQIYVPTGVEFTVPYIGKVASGIITEWKPNPSTPAYTWVKTNNTIEIPANSGNIYDIWECPGVAGTFTGPTAYYFQF